MAEALSIRALCDLDDLKGLLPGLTPGEADPADDVLTRLANVAADLIYRFVGDAGEFVSRDAVADPDGALTLPGGKATVPATARDFDVVGVEMLDWANDDCYRVLELGALADVPTLVTVRDPDGNELETVGSSKYVCLERRREPGSPITALWFRPDVTQAADLRDGYVIEVTGVWGWPAIPEAARQAAIETAIAPYAKDLAKFSATFNLDSNRIEIPRELPDKARRTLKAIRGGRVG